MNMGIGAPQALCLETPQFLKRKLIFSVPLKLKLFSSVNSEKASSKESPFNLSELIKIPLPSMAPSILSNSPLPSSIT